MRRLLPLAPILLLLTACAGTPQISALHDPLYRAENHTSTITARATESRDGIASITINATVGELTSCAAFFPSLIPCRTGAVGMGVVCTFPNTKTQVTCALPISITPQRLVTYSATATSARGQTALSGSVTYAGGAPLTSISILGLTVPWETARPVIWRTDAPASGTERGDKIDLGFVPDPDMPSYRAFTDDLQAVALPLFYTDTNQFSTWPRLWKNLFNLWAGPAGADGEGCTRTFTTPASTVMTVFDGTAILHRNAFRDCASISLCGGSGTNQTTLGDASWVLTSGVAAPSASPSLGSGLLTGVSSGAALCTTPSGCDSDASAGLASSTAAVSVNRERPFVITIKASLLSFVFFNTKLNLIDAVR